MNLQFSFWYVNVYISFFIIYIFFCTSVTFLHVTGLMISIIDLFVQIQIGYQGKFENTKISFFLRRIYKVAVFGFFPLQRLYQLSSCKISRSQINAKYPLSFATLASQDEIKIYGINGYIFLLHFQFTFSQYQETAMRYLWYRITLYFNLICAGVLKKKSG